MRMAGERPHRLRQEVDAGARRNIIEHERQGRRVCDRGIVRKQACLCPFIIVGRNGQQRIRAVLCRKLCIFYGACRAVRPDAHDNGAMAAGSLLCAAQERQPLVLRQGRSLAGRAADNERRDPGIQLPLKQAVPCRKIDAPVRPERGEERRGGAPKDRQHSDHLRVILCRTACRGEIPVLQFSGRNGIIRH